MSQKSKHELLEVVRPRYLKAGKVEKQKIVELLPLRKKNSLRPVPPYMTYMQAAIRKVVETTGSLIERLLPKSIHAITAKGFELKIALVILAASINFLW